MAVETRYRGRFAPSPTGPLHIGSLMAAVGSYLEARTRGGEWLVRIEDLDLQREIPGASSLILKTLEHFGFTWDSPVVYQSTRARHYEAALAALQRAQKLYPCACTRSQIAASAKFGVDGPVYPGTCRNGLKPGQSPRAWRIRVDDRLQQFEDALQGALKQHLATDVGDFVLKRADGCYAYQLAVVVDDADQGITHVVRGADLLDSTPRQIFLQQQLGLPTPNYMHLPVAVNTAGEKLSKQTLAPALTLDDPGQQLWQALHLLGQYPPPELARSSTRELWQWALLNWRHGNVPHVRSIPAD